MKKIRWPINRGESKEQIEKLLKKYQSNEVHANDNSKPDSGTRAEKPQQPNNSAVNQTSTRNQPGIKPTESRQRSLILFAEIKSLVDSLNRVKRPVKTKHLHDADFDYSLEAKLRDSISADPQGYDGKIYLESSGKMDELIRQRDNVSEPLLYAYLRSAYYYSWDLMDDEQYDKAMRIINHTDSLMQIINVPLSAKIYYCLSGFENAKGNYSGHFKDYEKSYDHANRAIEYAYHAALTKPQNVYYLRALSTFLKNAVYDTPDSLLSNEEKGSYLSLSLSVANYINGIDDKGFAGAAAYYGVADSVKSLVGAARYADAERFLNTTILEFNKFIKNDSLNHSNYIYRAELYLKIADIRSKSADTAGQRVYIDTALKDWITYVKTNKVLVSDLGDFQDTYNAIVTGFSDVYKTEEIYNKDMYISKALEGLNPLYAKQSKIATILFYLNNFIAYHFFTQDDQNRIATALPYYSKAIDAFEKGKLLHGYSDFSEDYAKFLETYSERLELNIKFKNDQMIAADYGKINKIFSPLYQKYPFDINQGKYLTQVNKLYGEYLYQKDIYDKAIAPLDMASFNGDKQSTEYLEKIYKTKNYADTAKSNLYALRDQSQSEGRKVYTAPADFNGISKSVDIYVFDRAKGYPYKGIDDQAEWWKKARGAVISQDVVDLFSRIQDIAWKYNTSFKELIIYTIDNKKSREILAPYEAFKDRIGKEKNLTRKLALIDSLSHLYDAGLKNDTANSKIIKKDAIAFYLEYAKTLTGDKQVRQAQDLYNRILELDPGNIDAKEAKAKIRFDEHKNNPSILVNTNDADELELFLGFYAEGKADKKNAVVIVNKLHAVLDQIYSKIQPADSALKSDLSIHYNNLAWNCLLLNITDNTIEFLTKSIELDPTDVYPVGNLPHAYLLMGEFEKAKEKYLALKDMKFDKMRTFKDVFLSDLKDFKSKGIKNAGIQKMIDILSGN